MADAVIMLNLRMLGPKHPTILLASAEPALLARVEPALNETESCVKFALSAHAALAAIKQPEPPALVLLDAALPGLETEQLLASVRADFCDLPILLIADAVNARWRDWLAEGVIDDLVLRSADPAYWVLRAEKAMRAFRLEQELEALHEAVARDVQHDRLTGVLNREALLAALFCETDRVQRAKGSLSLILFDIDDFSHWNSRLGANACDELLCQVAARTARLLRSYDLLGRIGKDEFLVGLPGCATAQAAMLAERLRMEVFAEPFPVSGEAIRLSACFGIAQSLGRSPVVVLREAEQALVLARDLGPESIQDFGRSNEPAPAPVTFLSPASGEKLLAW